MAPSIISPAELLAAWPSWYAVTDVPGAQIDMRDPGKVLRRASTVFAVPDGLSPAEVDSLGAAIGDALPAGVVLLMFPNRATRRRMQAALFGMHTSPGGVA